MTFGRLVGWVLGVLLTIGLLRRQRSRQDQLRVATQLCAALKQLHRCP